MSVNAGLAHVSTDFMIAALLIYSLALLAFAGDYAFGRPRRAASAAAAGARSEPPSSRRSARPRRARPSARRLGARWRMPPAGPVLAGGARWSRRYRAGSPRGRSAGGAFRAIGEAGPWVTRRRRAERARHPRARDRGHHQGAGRATAPRGATCTSSSRR